MRAKHNSAPENGLHRSQRPSESNPQERKAVSGFRKKSNSQDFTTITRGTGAIGPHECQLVRNSKNPCAAFKAGGLPEALRCFARHHDWHEPGPITNRLKVWLAFKKPVHAAANKLLFDRRDGLSEQIRAEFKRILEMCRPLDDLCGRRIDEVDELGALEHTKATLAERMSDLAELIEGSQVPHRHGGLNPQKRDAVSDLEKSDSYITFSEAAAILGVTRGTVSKWSKKGRFTDNGLKGQKRRLSKVCVLLVKQEIDDEYLKNDAAELRNDARRIR
jgi:hypothetical protein